MPYFPPAGGGVLLPNSIDNTLLADMADATIKGRAFGAGVGDPTDLTVAQALTLLGLTSVPKLLGTLVAANSAQLDFIGLDPTKYGSYQVRGVGFTPGTDAGQIRLLGSSNGGASYDTGSNYPLIADQIDLGDTVVSVGTVIATSFAVTGAMKLASGVTSFVMDILPANFTVLQARSFGYSSLNKWSRINNGGSWTGQMNAFRLTPSVGVIATGTAYVYGWPK